MPRVAKKEEKLETLDLNKQRKLKGLSKAIYVFAKICKILTLISAVCVFIFVVIIPFVNNNIKFEKGKIQIYEEVIEYKINDNEVEIINNNNKHVINNSTEVEAFKLMANYMENHNVNLIIWLIEIGFIVLTVVLVSAHFVFKNVDKLFTNIYREDTPFTLENVSYINEIANLLIFIYLLPLVVLIVINLLFKLELNISFNLIGLLYILIVFSLSYIFEYGYYLQNNSKIRLEKDVD